MFVVFREVQIKEIIEVLDAHGFTSFVLGVFVLLGLFRVCNTLVSIVRALTPYKAPEPTSVKEESPEDEEI